MKNKDLYLDLLVMAPCYFTGAFIGGLLINAAFALFSDE